MGTRRVKWCSRGARPASGDCCPGHRTQRIAKLLLDSWMDDVRASGVPGGVDSIAVIVAAEGVKRNLIETMERKYAVQGGAAAIAGFHADLEEALKKYLVVAPGMEAS